MTVCAWLLVAHLWADVILIVVAANQAAHRKQVES